MYIYRGFLRKNRHKFAVLNAIIIAYSFTCEAKVFIMYVAEFIFMKYYSRFV